MRRDHQTHTDLADFTHFHAHIVMSHPDSIVFDLPTVEEISQWHCFAKHCFATQQEARTRAISPTAHYHVIPDLTLSQLVTQQLYSSNAS